MAFNRNHSQNGGVLINNGERSVYRGALFYRKKGIIMLAVAAVARLFTSHHQCVVKIMLAVSC